MRASSLLLLCFSFYCYSQGQTAEPLRVSFEKELPKNFKSNIGTWKIYEGKLLGREEPKDKHAAAARLTLALSDAEIQCQVQLKSAQAFHLGFDPKPGSLKKKGHLFNVVVTANKVMIQKCRDKNDDNSKNETLAEASCSSLPLKDSPVTLKIVLKGNKISVKLGEKLELTAEDESFHVAKPGLVFRAIKGEVLIDDLKIALSKK